MDSISPFGGSSTCQLSTTRSDLRDSLAVAPPRKPHRDGGGTCSAHPKSARSNESTDPPRVERHHRTQRTENFGCHPGRKARSGRAGTTVSFTCEKQPGYGSQGTGGRLSRGT